tara:strand:- start:47 stop:682 length:636 start_codon:yes stop_codon:yes gene_type:complete
MPIEFNMQIAVKNIIAIRRKAKPEDVAAGIAWYAEAYEECRQLAEQYKSYGIAIHVVAGVVAALSPNNRWSTNVTNARDLIDAFVNGRSVDSVSVCTYNAMRDKAWHILGQIRPSHDSIKTILNGKKIVCFYENIMGDDTCTIDGHARNIAYAERVSLTDDKTSIGVKEYANLQEAYRQAAKRCTVNGRKFKAYELQAVTWVTWRKMHGIA